MTTAKSFVVRTPMGNKTLTLRRRLILRIVVQRYYVSEMPARWLRADELAPWETQAVGELEDMGLVFVDQSMEPAVVSPTDAGKALWRRVVQHDPAFARQIGAPSRAET
jgi:hypothetical protein